MKKSNIGIITFPIAANGNIPLSNLIDIVYSLSNNLYLVTGNDGYKFFRSDKRLKVLCVEHKSGLSPISRVCKYIHTNLKLSSSILKLRNDVDIWIFFIGGDTLLLPMLTVKILRKHCILSLASSATQILKSSKDKFYKVSEFLSFVNFTLSDKIVLHSKNLLYEWNMKKFQKKVFIAHEYFLDFDHFYLKKDFRDRQNLVGYIGTLTEAKGILNYVLAIPKVIEKRNDLKFLIAGKGSLFDLIVNQLHKSNLNDTVTCLGWIPHDKLPEYLNETKLLVIPSYTESGPIIALEAMACGTPILITRVGQISNMINDGENGFILENNSPECIAANIIRVLSSNNLEQVILNAKDLVRQNFTYESAVEKYKMVLESI